MSQPSHPHFPQLLWLKQFAGTHPWINSQIIQASENKDVGHLLGISAGEFGNPPNKCSKHSG